jgi:hypothetical protein
MGQCAAQTFSNITPDKWLALQTKASANQVILHGDSGEIAQQGFTLSWHYDTLSATLTIQCMNRPLWAPCGRDKQGPCRNPVEPFPGSSGRCATVLELRRIVYNCVLTAVVKGWIVFGCIDVAPLPLRTDLFIVPENNCSRAAGERLLLCRLRRRHSLVAVISDKPLAGLASRSLAGRNSFRNTAGNLLDC